MNNSINNQFKQLIEKINNEGIHSSPRGLQVKELELQTLELDPNFTILDFKARPFDWKYFLGELSWYLQRDTNTSFINNFSNFWQKIATPEGYVNSNYGYILFDEQLEWAKKSLIKDKHTRQAVCFVNRPKYQYEGNKDFVCTMYLNFWIRDNKLNMKVQMRSNDMFYGLTFDAPFFAFVQQTMWHWLRETYQDIELGKYYHCADNIHYYERHFEKADRISKESAKDPVYFMLKEPLFNSKDGQYILLPTGQKFISDVQELVNQSNETKITNESAKEILSNYFWIQ
jgi:thymidylate synthase